jgi:hypothetical protein
MVILKPILFVRVLSFKRFWRKNTSFDVAFWNLSKFIFARLFAQANFSETAKGCKAVWAGTGFMQGSQKRRAGYGSGSKG